MAGKVNFDFVDAKGFPLQSGGTWGSAVDIPGARSLSWNQELGSEQVTGDGETLALVTTSNELSGSIELAVNNLAAFALFTGAEVVSTGTGNTAATHYVASSRLRRPYLQLHGLAPGVADDGGMTQIALLKMKASNGPSMAIGRDINYPGFDIMGQSYLGAHYILSQHVDDEFELPTTALTALPEAA